MNTCLYALLTSPLSELTSHGRWMTPSRAPEWLGDGPRVPVAYTYMNGRECYALALGSTGTHPINCRQGPLVGRADRSEPNASAPRAAGQLDWTVGPPRPGAPLTYSWGRLFNATRRPPLNTTSENPVARGRRRHCCCRVPIVARRYATYPPLPNASSAASQRPCLSLPEPCNVKSPKKATGNVRDAGTQRNMPWDHQPFSLANVREDAAAGDRRGR
jgi:hypothetical protein